MSKIGTAALTAALATTGSAKALEEATLPSLDTGTAHTIELDAKGLEGTSFDPKLKLQFTQQQEQDPAATQTHKVKAGDSLWSIAEQYLGKGTRWKEIADLNGLDENSKLQIGQEIQVPGTAKTYTVKSGDTLEEISLKQYGSKDHWEAIAEANGISDPRKLQVGAKLRLPDLGEVKSAESGVRPMPNTLVTSPDLKLGTYTTVTQGTVVNIAALALKDAGRWPEIIALNPELSLGGIPRGTEVTIPAEGRVDVSQNERVQKFLNRDIPRVVQSTKGAKYSHVVEFLSEYADAAAAVERRYGIPSELVLAQAALETGWGRSATKGHNYFGIKAYGAWDGGSTTETTHEVVNGQRIKIDDKFRAYANAQESFVDYGRFLSTQSHYRRAFRFLDSCEGMPTQRDTHQFTESIARKYATDPQYATKLKQAMTFMEREVVSYADEEKTRLRR